MPFVCLHRRQDAHSLLMSVLWLSQQPDCTFSAPSFLSPEPMYACPMSSPFLSIYLHPQPPLLSDKVFLSGITRVPSIHSLNSLCCRISERGSLCWRCSPTVSKQAQESHSSSQLSHDHRHHDHARIMIGWARQLHACRHLLLLSSSEFLSLRSVSSIVKCALNAVSYKDSNE